MKRAMLMAVMVFVVAAGLWTMAYGQPRTGILSESSATWWERPSDGCLGGYAACPREP